MEQNDRLEKNKDFFQGKQLFNTKLLHEMKSDDWYMLKVQQKNGHIAWTSPIKISK